MNAFKKFIGPRIPSNVSGRERTRFWLPTILFGTAALLLFASIAQPYWEMELLAPQYPKGLHVTAFVHELTGDLFEINGLNHYIGMRPLEEAAQLERSLSRVAIGLLAVLTLISVFIHTKWVVLLALPAISMPVVFLADLQWWLWRFGTDLDPKAPLSSAVKPFIPVVLGRGKIAQFETMATPGIGLYLAISASILVLIGLYFHRLVYKPLVESSNE